MAIVRTACTMTLDPKDLDEVVGIFESFIKDVQENGVTKAEVDRAKRNLEAGRMRELERRSVINGVPGLQWLNGTELHELEPDVAGVAALLSPTTAIVDYPAVARSYGADVLAVDEVQLRSLRFRSAVDFNGLVEK